MFLFSFPFFCFLISLLSLFSFSAFVGSSSYLHKMVCPFGNCPPLSIRGNRIGSQHVHWFTTERIYSSPNLGYSILGLFYSTPFLPFLSAVETTYFLHDLFVFFFSLFASFLSSPVRLSRKKQNPSSVISTTSLLNPSKAAEKKKQEESSYDFLGGGEGGVIVSSFVGSSSLCWFVFSLSILSFFSFFLSVFLPLFLSFFLSFSLSIFLT